jgi:hypothetical protein
MINVYTRDSQTFPLKWKGNTAYGSCLLRTTHTHTHTHTHIHIHTHTNTLAYTHTHIYTHIYTCTHTYTHIHTNTHTHKHTYIHIHIHTYIDTNKQTRIHIHTNTHTHIHTNTYTHKHTYTQEFRIVYIWSGPPCPEGSQGPCEGLRLCQRIFVLISVKSVSMWRCEPPSARCDNPKSCSCLLR